MASEKVVGDVSLSENTNRKEILVSQVKGKVKWFNVELGYGFINREDTNEDVFVHHTAIARYNTRHQLSSLADGEEVEFDVVQGKKGQEAANVCGPNGDQVKGSRFASNLYAGRFRFRRGANYGGERGERRFYSRRQYRDRSTKESQSEETKQGDNEKIPADGNKEVIRSKKYSRNRKVVGGKDGRVEGPDGRLKRSSSLPSNLERYASGNGYRRRRRGPRTSDGRPFLRPIFPGPKRRGPRSSEKEYSGDKVQEQKPEDAEPHQISLKSEKEGRGEGESKGSVKGRKPSGRRTNQEGKSEKTDEHSSIEKSDKSQPSRGKKRTGHGRRSKKNSEVAAEKLENSQSAPEDDDRRKGKDDSGDGNIGNGNGRSRRGGGRWRKRGGRPGGRSSSTDLSTQTPSTREGEDTKSHGGNGDGGKSEPGATEGNIVKGTIPEVVVGKAG